MKRLKLLLKVIIFIKVKIKIMSTKKSPSAYRIIEIIIDVLTLGLALISKWANKKNESSKK